MPISCLTDCKLLEEKDFWLLVEPRVWHICRVALMKQTCRLVPLVFFDVFVVVQSLSRVWLFVTHGLQHTRLLCPPPSPRVCSDSCPLSWWGCLTTSSSAAPFSFCLQSFPASGSFPMSRLFASGGQSIRASASTPVLSMNIQGWFPIGLTGLISLLSNGLSRVFSSTTI